MSVVGNQDVLGFEFPVDDALVMENFDANNNLGKQVSDDIFLKNVLFSTQVVVDVSLRMVFHHNVDLGFVLEGFLDGDK